MSDINLEAIEARLTAQDPDEVLGRYLVVVAAFLPFWEQAIGQMTSLTNKTDKVENYRAIAGDSFRLMFDWYFGQKPYVKARRKEIDTVISFVRNAALRQTISSMPAAAAARNLSGVLRIAVYMAVRDYRPKDYPRLMTSGLLNLAAVKSLFPVDTTDLIMQFASPGQPPSEHAAYLQQALEKGAEHYGLQKELAVLYQTLDELWRHFDTPQVWKAPDSAWEPGKTHLLSEVHFQGVQDFHSRTNTSESFI